MGKHPTYYLFFKQKTTIQSTVVKKLSNTKRSNKTLAALREYDRVIKCIYVLDYADNKSLRQFVQQALNRGEAYHQLRRAIASVNGNQFRGGNDYQIDQWNDCARLIANCVIYYNSAILSRLVEKFEKENNKNIIYRSRRCNNALRRSFGSRIAAR